MRITESRIARGKDSLMFSVIRDKAARTSFTEVKYGMCLFLVALT